MTTVLESSGRVQAAVSAVWAAARLGLPLTDATFPVNGSDKDAEVLFATAQKALAEAGVPFERADTDLMHRLIVDCGDGVTWRWFHCRCASLATPERAGAS